MTIEKLKVDVVSKSFKSIVTLRTMLTAFSLVVLSSTLGAYAQVPENLTELNEIISHNDCILFDNGFNKCNMEVVKSCVSEDMEFYHNIGGVSVAANRKCHDLAM